jgi:hypothetical protein
MPNRGPYQEIAFADFSGGLNTKIDSNMIADNQSPDMQNVIFDGKGSLMPRLGNVMFGAATSASGKIRRTWTTVNVFDIEVPLRQIDNTSTSWIEYYSPQTAAWENLDAGYTTGYDFGNAYYDYFTYYCSKKDHQRRWNGALHTISAAIGIGHTSCALTTSAVSTLGFLSAGSVVIDGEEVYMLSADANKLHIPGAFVAAHTANKAIAQLPTSADYGWCSATSTLPKGSIM